MSSKISTDQKRAQDIWIDVPCTCPVKLSLGSCTKDIHYVAWLARGGGIPELQISAAAKYEVDADAPPLPQPLKFVPIKNLKTGVVHIAAFIAKPPRRI